MSRWWEVVGLSKEESMVLDCAAVLRRVTCELSVCDASADGQRETLFSSDAASVAIDEERCHLVILESETGGAVAQGLSIPFECIVMHAITSSPQSLYLQAEDPAGDDMLYEISVAGIDSKESLMHVYAAIKDAMTDASAASAADGSEDGDSEGEQNGPCASDLEDQESQPELSVEDPGAEDPEANTE